MDPSIGRKQLPHEIPDGVQIGPEDEVFFITICCLPRGLNQLAHPEVWQTIHDSLIHRERPGDLRVRLVLSMPDHLHGLFSFPGPKPMVKVMADFKSWVAKTSGVKWQRDFFDHRLRGVGIRGGEGQVYQKQSGARGFGDPVGRLALSALGRVGRIRLGPPCFPPNGGAGARCMSCACAVSLARQSRRARRSRPTRLAGRADPARSADFPARMGGAEARSMSCAGDVSFAEDNHGAPGGRALPGLMAVLKRGP